MTDPLGDHLRSALRAEADGIHANEELLLRVQKAAARSAGWRKLSPLLAVAAVTAVVVGLAVVLFAGGDGDGAQEVDAVDDPATTTSEPTPVQPPMQAVAVTQSGHVVVIDTRTGTVTRDLGGFDDPTDPATAALEGGAFSITGLALHPNGREVFIETCCEPAVGIMFRIPIDGSVPIDDRLFDQEAGHQVGHGYGIDISADGRWLAYVNGPIVSVMELETGEVPHTFESGDGTHDWVQAAINADGSVIAIERALERGALGEVLRSDARTTSLRDGAYEEHPTTGGRFMPLWLGAAGLGNASAPGERLRDANVDASGQWILVVTDDGRLVARGDPAPAEIPGDGYLAADW